MTFSLQNFKGFLLDFDGTLANTEPIHAKAIETLFAKKGYTNTKGEAGKSTLHIFREWGEEIGEPEKAERYLEEYLEFAPQFFSEHLDMADWFDDAKKILEVTKDSPRVLVTGAYHAWLKPFDPKLKIYKRFEHFVTKEDVLPDNEKPDPLAYTLGAQLLGLEPNECLAIEDSYS